jgi:hypothetical protein
MVTSTARMPAWAGIQCLALGDFHRAGMYPERQVAMLGGAILAVVAGIVMIRRARVRRIGGSV